MSKLSSTATKKKKKLSPDIDEKSRSDLKRKRSTKKKISSGSKTSKTLKTKKSKNIKFDSFQEIKSDCKLDNGIITSDCNQDCNQDYNVDDIINIIECDILKNKNRDQQDIQKNAQLKKTADLEKIKSDTLKEEIETEINDTSTQSYIDSKKFLTDKKIKISTITLDCKLHVIVDTDKLAKYVILREDGIVSIKYGDRKNAATNRTIVAVKKKQSTKNFYNQVTILMKPTNNPTKNYMNIKVFDNGSVHVTGCTDIDDFNNVMGTLIKILKKGQDIRTKHDKIRHIEYINDKKKIGIYDAKIRMINSNFKLPYKIDRKKVAFLLKKYHGNRTTDTEIGYVEFKHKPNGGHSCVNIKFKYDEISTPSIFMFQTGAIIITGAKNLYQIIAAYHYIFLIIDKYLGQIKIIELNPKLVNAEIELYCKERQKKQLCSDENQLNLNLLEANKFNKSDKQKRPNKPIKLTKSTDDRSSVEKKSTKKKIPSKEIRFNKAKIFHFEREIDNPPSDTEYDSVTESEEIPEKKVTNKSKKNNSNKKAIISI